MADDSDTEFVEHPDEPLDPLDQTQVQVPESTIGKLTPLTEEYEYEDNLLLCSVILHHGAEIQLHGSEYEKVCKLKEKGMGTDEFWLIDGGVAFIDAKDITIIILSNSLNRQTRAKLSYKLRYEQNEGNRVAMDNEIERLAEEQGISIEEIMQQRQSGGPTLYG